MQHGYISISELSAPSYQLQISPHKTKKCQHIITSKVCKNQELITKE